METTQQLKNNESESLREIVRWYDNEPKIYIEQNLWIKTKEGNLAQLKLNTPQNLIYERIREIKARGKPIRIIILKARQEGVSTLCEGLIFERTARHENTHALIVAHEPESTDNIFQMSKLFYDMLKRKPMRRYDNKKQMVFENPNEETRGRDPGLRSRMVISTASKTKIGRGLTLQCFHGSEIAFWENAKELMTSVMQAIPDHPNTMAFLESTANGMGGDGEYFYNMVQDTLAKRNDFELIFLPWFLMPEYSMRFESEGDKKKFADVLDEYEKDIQKRLSITLEQLNWRRWAIKNKCGGDVEKFKQEYPATVEEAFIASSKLVIPKQYIEAQRKFVREPIRMLDDILIYEDLKWNHYYSLGADPSEGVGRDESSFTVFDRMTGREVAHYANNQIAPDLFARKMIKAAEYFNNAILVPEINAHGLTTLNELQKLGYSNIFRQRYFDHVSKEWTQRLGWKTSKISKPLMVDEFIQALREEEVGLSTAATVSQMLAFVHTDEPDRHGMGAETGQKDDLLISAMLAWQGLKDLPSKFKYK